MKNLFTNLKNLKANLKAWWKLDEPNAATAIEFKRWEDKVKEVKPIQYYIQNTIPQFFKSYYTKWYTYGILNKYWDLQYRFNPEHKYHLVDTGLKPNYYIMEKRMLHALFSLLVSFVEEQHQFNDPENEYSHWPSIVKNAAETLEKDEVDESGCDDRPMARAMLTANSLYKWWTTVRPNRKRVSKDFKFPKDFDPIIFIGSGEDMTDWPHYDTWKKMKKICAINNDMKEKWNKEDTNRMHNLINIRRFLY